MSVLWALVLLFQDKSAEEALSHIDRMLSTSKSLRVEVRADIRIQFDDHEEKTTLSGKIVARRPNKARVELSRVRGGEETRTLIISDETRVLDNRAEEMLEAPKDFNNSFVFASLSLTGITSAYATTFHASQSADYDVRKKFALSGVRTEPDEGELKSLSYTLAFGEHSTQVRIWYSPKLLHPTRRVLVSQVPKATITTTETYDKYVIDAEVEDRNFEIPAKK